MLASILVTFWSEPPLMSILFSMSNTIPVTITGKF